MTLSRVVVAAAAVVKMTGTHTVVAIVWVNIVPRRLGITREVAVVSRKVGSRVQIVAQTGVGNRLQGGNIEMHRLGSEVKARMKSRRALDRECRVLNIQLTVGRVSVVAAVKSKVRFFPRA